MRKKRPANTPLTARDNLFLGVMTGALVGAAVAPLDLVVTRVLVNPTRYSGLVASVRTIAREEGFRGLFAGSLQKLSREAAASGLFFTCYEGALAKLGISDDDD
jgi:solute carrier family 25 (mitochondrial thiamine pyrophosphate transporter), member 19